MKTTAPCPRALRRFPATTLLLALLPAMAPLATLHAQSTSKIFVASYGNDANDGSRGSPKRNFQPAHDSVAGGGQIVVLDTAGYGALAITKSVSVTVPPGVNGFVTVSGSSNGITITAGANASVSLRGLIVEGSGNSGYGINATTVGSLIIENCLVRNFDTGINLVSSAALTASLLNCGASGCVDGLVVTTSAAVGVFVRAKACRLDANSGDGVFASAFFSGSTVDVHLIDCAVAGNGFGVFSSNSNSVVRLNNCDISGNTTGLSTASGGVILSRTNNTIEKNTNGNTFPSTYSAK